MEQNPFGRATVARLRRPDSPTEMANDRYSSLWSDATEYVASLVGKAAGRHLISSTEIDDVVQEVLLAVAKQLPTFRGEASLPTWIAAIVSHKVINRYHDTRPDAIPITDYKSRYKHLLDPEDEPDDEIISSSTDHQRTPEALYLMREKLVEVTTCLKSYCLHTHNPKRNALILTLALYKGYGEKHVADNLEIKVQTVKSIVSGARKYLHQHINDYALEPVTSIDDATPPEPTEPVRDVADDEADPRGRKTKLQPD